MDPCSQVPSIQSTQHPQLAKDHKKVHRSTSLVNVQLIDHEPRALDRRVSKSSKNLRVSIRDNMDIYQRPAVLEAGEAEPGRSMGIKDLFPNDGIVDRPSIDFDEYRIGVHKEDLERIHPTSKISRVSTPRPVPTILDRLNVMLNETENQKLKLHGNFCPALIGTNLLYWKEIDRIFIFGFVSDKKAKKLTAEALVYMQNEIAELIKRDVNKASYQELVSIYEKLRENKFCQQVFKEKPDLKFNFAHLIKLISVTEPTPSK